MAVILGPACALPTCIQFRLPTAIGRMEFSARLLDNPKPIALCVRKQKEMATQGIAQQ
jgi:hypothetical protein